MSNPAWVKGVSGNPGGRPKNDESMSAILRQLLATPGKDGVTPREAIMRKLITKAQAGELDAMKLLLERSEGKVPERKEHTGADAGPITITVTYTDRAIDTMKDEEHGG